MHLHLASLHEHMKRHFQGHAHLWKRIAIVAFLLTQATSFFLYGNGFSWSYPLKEVAKNSECRKMKWSELSDDCKQPLPIIHGANYSAYKDNPAYTSIYTTMWGAPYSNGWAIGEGAHEWVDIVSSEGTPVYAVEDGIVIKAKAQPGYGNVVMIKHTMENGKVVFSVYGHLKHIYALQNGTVKEGDLIGTVGNEGFSFGNHLLWDINITPTNTYAFWECPEYGNGSTFNAIANVVEKGLCRDYLLQRTADPIAWVESQGGTLALGNSNTSLPSLANASTKRRIPLVPLAPAAVPAKSTQAVASYSTKALPPTTTSTQKSLATLNITSKDLPKNAVAFASVDSVKAASSNGTAMEINNVSKLGEDFLSKYTIKISPSFRNTLSVGQTSSIVISVTDKNGKPYVGALPKDLTLIPSENIVTLSPQVVRLTNNEGKAVVLVSADVAGSADLVISYNMKSLAKIAIKVQ